MQVKEIMSKNPTYLPPNSTIKEAAEKMIKLDCGFIPVSENDRLVGTVTDRDIVLRATSKGKDASTALKDVMSEKVLYCFEDDDVEDAAENMSKNQIRRLIVLNKDKRFTGVLSLGDVARKNHDKEISGETIEAISQK